MRAAFRISWICEVSSIPSLTFASITAGSFSCSRTTASSGFILCAVAVIPDIIRQDISSNNLSLIMLVRIECNTHESNGKMAILQLRCSSEYGRRCFARYGTIKNVICTIFFPVPPSLPHGNSRKCYS